jgi:hypothetical protein
MAALSVTASAESATTYVAISRYESLFGSGQGSATSVVGETAMFVGKIDSLSHFIKVVTVNPADGERLGVPLLTALPQGPCFPSQPAELWYSEHFMQSYGILVGRELEVAFLPVIILSDGTAVSGSWGCMERAEDADAVGSATSVTEIAGPGFNDGRPRLFIGTDKGYVLMLKRGQSGAVELEDEFELAAGKAISDLGAVPQLGGIVLGVAAGHEISGWGMSSGTPQPLFRLIHPDRMPVRAFRTIEPEDEPWPEPDRPITIVFCDGWTDRVYYGDIPPDLFGIAQLNSVLEPPVLTGTPGARPLPFTGSLLLLPGDRKDVFFQPGVLDGTSIGGCRVAVTEEAWTPCSPCPIAVTGDVDESASLTATDVIRLVSHVFKGGVAPQPCPAAGDVDCSGSLTSSDIIRLINHIFKAGPAPCNVCSKFAGSWTCP